MLHQSISTNYFLEVIRNVFLLSHGLGHFSLCHSLFSHLQFCSPFLSSLNFPSSAGQPWRSTSWSPHAAARRGWSPRWRPSRPATPSSSPGQACPTPPRPRRQGSADMSPCHSSVGQGEQ